MTCYKYNMFFQFLFMRTLRIPTDFKGLSENIRKAMLRGHPASGCGWAIRLAGFLRFQVLQGPESRDQPKFIQHVKVTSIYFSEVSKNKNNIVYQNTKNKQNILNIMFARFFWFEYYF